MEADAYIEAASMAAKPETSRRRSCLIAGLAFGFVAGLAFYQATGIVCAALKLDTEPFRDAVKRKPSSKSACSPKVVTQYYSSDLEQAWLANAAVWEKDYCKVINTPTQRVAVGLWLNGVAKADRSSIGQGCDPTVFSRFETSVRCGPSNQTFITWIEPLSHGLRHPNSLCPPHDTKAALFDMSYLLLQQQANVNALRTAFNQSCPGRACQAIYMDLGATVWSNNVKEAGQGWFVRNYEKQGITFDRLLLWEAQPITPPSKVYQQLPLNLLHKYQYFNMPATANLSLPSHPVRVIKDIAQPGDFVVLKLDIDNSANRMILNAFLQDDEAFSLVDEFFFEHHVDFVPMRRHWGKRVDPNASLSDSYGLFLKLRQKGWRAHSWV